EIIGGCSSTMATDCVQVSIFPERSVTVQVTMVTPSGKTTGASLVTLAMPQLSLTVGLPSTTAPGSHSTTSGGQVIVGSSTSPAVTVWVQVSIFPARSVTVQVTIATPIG